MNSVGDMKGVVEKIMFYRNVNHPVSDPHPYRSQLVREITKRDSNGYFMFETGAVVADTGDVVHCRLHITRLSGETYYMNRSFGILRYATSTDPNYEGGLIG